MPTQSQWYLKSDIITTFHPQDSTLLHSPVITLVTPNHGGPVILLPTGRADPDFVAGLVQVTPHSLGDDAGGLVTGVRLHNLLRLNLDLGLLYTGRSRDWSLS